MNTNENQGTINIRTDASGREWLLTTNGNAAYRVFYDKRAKRRIFVQRDWSQVPQFPLVTDPHYTAADYGMEPRL